MSRAVIDTRHMSEKALQAAGREFRETLHWKDDETCQLIAEVYARRIIIAYVREAEQSQ